MVEKSLAGRENHILRVEHVSAGYGQGFPPILKDISFSVPAGRRVCILGANGSGKTTLLRVMLGLLPCSEGRVLLNGQDLHQMKRREVASQMALMTQLPETYFSYSVRETVMQGRFLKSKGMFPMPPRQDREFVEELLRATGVEEIADRPVTELSGGQRQRVFFARTLAQETPFLFLDEPTNHMDLKVQAELTDYLLGWAEADPGRTLVAVFHDINLALCLAQDVVVLRKGELLACGPAEETLTEEVLREAFGFDVAGYMREQLERWG